MKSFTEELKFLKEKTGKDEAAILAQAVKVGIDNLFREYIITSYLNGEIKRNHVVKFLDPKKIAKIDAQKKAIDEDIEWGLNKG